MIAAEDYSPIERSSVAEAVAHRLLEMVRTKVLKAGDQLPPERELATYMQVSRPSLREALRALQILGVVRMRQGGGVYISGLAAADLLAPLQFLITLDSQSIEALEESRGLIDGGICRLAATRIAEGALERLRSLVVAQQELLNDPTGFRISDTEFHGIIAQAAGNPFLSRVSQSLFVLGTEYQQPRRETPDELHRAVTEHHVLLEALAAHDPDAAASAMLAHLETSKQVALSAMQRHDSEPIAFPTRSRPDQSNP